MALPPLFNADGSINIDRVGLTAARDSYHRILSMSWWMFFTFAALGIVAINLVFAVLYRFDLEGIVNARPDRFADAFFFSVQTFSTIGFGTLSPGSMFVNVVATVEAIFGLLTTALLTGITFAKFARPTARVLFSEKVVVAEHDGQKMLMLRVANARGNQIVEASVHLTLGFLTTTLEGKRFRTLTDLKLRRSTSPLFALSWTIFHPIDEDSPLLGLSTEDLAERETLLIATLTGIDDTFHQTVHARTAYLTESFVFDHDFADLNDVRDGRRVIDFTNFDVLVPRAPE